jgi:hypothetical protein
VLLEAVLALIDGVMELLLLQMPVRLALLDVLTVLAAPALLCYAWPRLQHWAALWSRLFVATLITQFVQIAALRLLVASAGTCTPRWTSALADAGSVRCGWSRSQHSAGMPLTSRR